jgi:hypothetical protein
MIHLTWTLPTKKDGYTQEEGILIDIRFADNKWMFLILKTDGEFIEKCSENCLGEYRHKE